MTTPGCLLWDFHGTLGARSFSDAMLEALRAAQPEHPIDDHSIDRHAIDRHAIDKAALSQGIRGGFPWGSPAQPHTLTDPADWWREVEGLMQRGFERVGISSADAKHLSADAHRRYVDPATYEVYEDTQPTLLALRNEGWRHWILSNHTPDLPGVVNDLGWADLLEGVMTSAVIGYEKPHAGIYAHAREVVGHAPTLWMIGDNIEADVLGAERVGIPAILVRKADDRASRRSADLHGVRAFLYADAPPDQTSVA